MRARSVRVSLGLHALLWLISAALLFFSSRALAVPQLAWTETQPVQSRLTAPAKTIELRQIFEVTTLSGLTQTNQQALDAQSLWDLDEARFVKLPPNAKWNLKQGERLIGRFQLFNKKTGDDLVFSVNLPRVDAVYLAYRHDGEPWKLLGAGDTMAMERWAIPDVLPAFAIPTRPGKTDIVLQIAHRGMLYTDFLLQNERAYRATLIERNWLGGLLLGMNLMIGLLALVVAWNQRQSLVLLVSFISVCSILIVLTNSGLLGVLLPADNQGLNDVLKSLALYSWIGSLPIVTALLLHTRKSTAKLWVACLVFSGAVLVSLPWLTSYDNRDFSYTIFPWVIVASTALILFTIAFSVWSQSYRPGVLYVAVLLCVASVIVPYLSFLSINDSFDIVLLIGLFCLMASVCALQGLFLIHRLGRQVMVRAQSASVRDPLTGLVNRKGFELHMQQLDTRLVREPYCALLCYVTTADEAAAQNEVGIEGFEIGMVQMAATLCTGIKGMEELGRISPHAIAMTVLMRPDPAKAVRLAQSILTRSMVLADRGTELANSVRIALCWLPLYGMKLNGLEQRLREAVSRLDTQKRIAWVGGQDSYREMEQCIARERVAYVTPPESSEAVDRRVQAVATALTDEPLHERIRNLEREVFDNVDTAFLIAEADRLSDHLNKGDAAEQEPMSRNGLPSLKNSFVLDKMPNLGYSHTRVLLWVIWYT